MIDHPMTPTDEQLAAISDGRTFRDALRKAYTDGADAELEACCRLLDSGEHAASYGCHDGNSLREARRPKPPSLKRQALDALEEVAPEIHSTNLETIRKALEALSDD